MILVGTIKMWKSVVFITISSSIVISTINTVESFSTNGGLTGLSGLKTTVKKCSSSTSRVHYYSGKHHGWKEDRRQFAVPSRATTTNFQQRYAGSASSFDMADEVNKHDESNSVTRKNKKNILHVWKKLLHATICSYSNLVKSLGPIKRNNRKLYKLVSSLLLACSLIFASSTSSSFASSSSSLIKFNNSPTPTTATTTQVIQGTCKAVSARGGDMTKMLGGVSGGAAKVINKKKSTVAAAATMTKETSRTFREAFQDLTKFLRGPKSDTLWLLSATALITPIMKKIGASPILGFLATGMLLGPNGFGVIRSIHTTEILAELGIVFFLFEMGIELSVERLMSMKRDVFGLGLGQFVVSALAFALTIGRLPWPSIMPKLGNNALVVLGGGLALSSSAFVLQLLKDKDQLKTRFGKASFGVLLFQDLAVVPLLVVTPILAGKGSVARAVTNAVIKAAMALGSIEFVGRFVLNPLFRIVAQAKSQEAFLSMVLLTVLSMSFLTEGLGLSNTLGAFLAGVLISETKYKYQVEADIAPFRGVLLGLFFLTVGYEIDVKLIAAYPMLVSSIVLGIIGIKSAITTALSMAFGLSLANAQQTGLITSQGGEFAFVAFGLAKALGILDPTMTKVMLTSVSLTMALTPFLASLSGKIASKMEESSDFSHYLSEDPEAIEIKESNDFVVVAGYGIVGKVVCDLLAEKFVNFVGLEVNPDKAIQARNKGLPVFYGDISRPEVCEAFNIGKAKAVILTISQPMETNHAVVNLRRLYPDLKIFARAKDAKHQERLQKTLNVVAMVPILPEQNLLLTLPFGGAVLKSLGASVEEVNAILENKRKELMSSEGTDRHEGPTVVQSSDDDRSLSTTTTEESPLATRVIEASASSV